MGTGAYFGNDFPETYCSSTIAGCMDTNVDGTLAADPFNDRVSAFSTLFHDMFDDGPVAAGFGHNGSVWVESCVMGTCRPTDALVAVPSPSLLDENVAVPLNVLQIAIRAWLFEPVGGLAFTVPTVMRGVTRALRLAGVDDVSICALYEAHQPVANCGAWFP